MSLGLNVSNSTGNFLTREKENANSGSERSFYFLKFRLLFLSLPPPPFRLFLEFSDAA